MPPQVLADQRASSLTRRIRALARVELRVTIRRGESVLLNLGIPLGLLVFFSLVDVLPVDAATDDPVDFLTPGILALAVLSNAMTGLAISTGFERQYGVLRRLGVSPLSRLGLVSGKTVAVLAVLVLQTIAIGVTGLLLGWSPEWSGAPAAIGAVLLATLAFGGLGMTMAGRFSAEMTLGLANGLWLVLLLLGGIMVPLSELPGWMAGLARALPAGALSDILHGSIGTATAAGAEAWLVLGAWAVATPAIAARTFRWS